jgi:hypothetical protein
MSQSVPTSSHAQNLTGQTVNYFGPVLKGAKNCVQVLRIKLVCINTFAKMAMRQGG